VVHKQHELIKMSKRQEGESIRRLQVGTLFLVNFEPGKIFWGTIRNIISEEGGEVTSGDAVVEEGLMVSTAGTMSELRQKLCGICKLKLEFGLHSNKGISSEILQSEYFHN
jgi:hypothetical protein